MFKNISLKEQTKNKLSILISLFSLALISTITKKGIPLRFLDGQSLILLSLSHYNNGQDFMFNFSLNMIISILLILLIVSVIAVAFLTI